MNQIEPDLDDTLERLEKELQEFRRIKESLSPATTLSESSVGQVQARAQSPVAAVLD
jgi:hypothetical protein